MKPKPIFITGIGTDVGKTVVSAIVTEALGAAYWKPVQAGFDQGTDREWVAGRISRPRAMTLPEMYKLKLPASPHFAARQEGVQIDLDGIVQRFDELRGARDHFVIEGAGGLMVPLNDRQFVLDLVKKLDARVILVSRNYLGSINHSLQTAAVCRAHGLDVAGWIFNGEPSGYEEEISGWSGIRWIASVPHVESPDKGFIGQEAARIQHEILRTFSR